MKYNTFKDSLGEVLVPSDKYWGAQTQRSVNNFKIGSGHEFMPNEVISAIAIIKKAAAIVNNQLLSDKMTDKKMSLISTVSDEILSGKLDGNFPLLVYQTGSGTQTNMNVNEVIANRGNEIAGEKILHENDDINMSQSSNDVFPTAMHISALILIKNTLLPALSEIIGTLICLEKENEGIIKVGRTHLQDATPISFSQEISGWRSSLEKDYEIISNAAEQLKYIALGGTAVGTGLNAPDGFDIKVADEISKLTGIEFISAENKFHALTSKNELVFAHGAIKALACDLLKIANDVRWLASGPNTGLSEITIPANEPGSSIMPGKVNPTQCEQVTMVAVQIISNDVAVSMAASQGNFELNVYMPVLIYNFLQSIRLLSESISSFNLNCLKGIKANKEKMTENVNKSLMLVTCLNPHIGYSNACKVANLAHEKGITIKEACLDLGFMTESEFDKIFKPEEMV